MRKLIQWALVVTLVCGASVFTSCKSDNDSPAEEHSQGETPLRQRVIAFEGIENGRDMGSLVMQDGRTVRFDMPVRSGNLSTATDADAQAYYGQFLRGMLSAQVRGKEGGDGAVAFIRALIGVSRENFEATLDLIDQQYGSLFGYIENQLGFTKAEQQQLRAKYLSAK